MTLLRQPSLERPFVYPPLIPDFLTSCFEVLFLPPRPFRTAKPRTQDAFQAVALFLHMRCAFREICGPHRGAGSLLLTPWLDAQTTFAKLFADIGSTNDAHGPPPPAKVTAQHIQALRQDLRAERLSHAAGLTAHTCAVLFGSSKFLGRDKLGHSRTTVGLTRCDSACRAT